jgi:hypothetical protein
MGELLRDLSDDPEEILPLAVPIEYEVPADVIAGTDGSEEEEKVRV